LLIIDNADDKEFPVQDCFPDSNFGTILITTRNPLLKTQGTVGPRYFKFHGLEERKSIELLLKASDEPVPWIPSSVNSASFIAKAMGYLPLALIHAGATILAGLSTLETYLENLEETWNRIRQMKDPNAATPISTANATIYSTYELMLKGISTKKTPASEDALELLRIFSFLDRQQIKLNIFFRAASNPGLELANQINKERERKAYSKFTPKTTRAQALRNLIVRLVSLLSHLGHSPILPKLISESHGLGSSYELRLRVALSELSQMSLISTSSDLGNCYSMHAAVHLWARQRPEMTLVEQAVWCQMTATILSRAILLPPLDDTEEEETFRRDLLPHVRHVQAVEQKLQIIFTRNRESRKRLWPILQPTTTAGQLEQLVKFSLVYAQGTRHQVQEAERLQSYVAKFAIQYLGMEHIKTIKIMRLLSRTYWQLGQMDDAVKLLKQALDASINVLGQEHPETLQIMDSYGSSLWLQGRIQEARQVHATAVDGLRKTLGSDDIQTLKAMGGLGRAVGKDFDFSEAVSIQSKAFAGLKAKLGSSHSATLEAMDNLAMAHFDRAAYRQGQIGDLDRALELESEVFTVRLEKLGREHYHTLWAGLNLARIHAIRGEVEKALPIFLPGHGVVERDLGRDHFIFLFGELHHGRILMCAKRYEEAELILLNVVDSHKEKRRRHPDRLLAIFSLIKCRNVLGKDDQTASLLEELIEGTKAMFGADHAAVRYILDSQVLSKDTSDVVR
jgi:tetratricopeptide (TPR) repeat protein